MSVFVPVPEIDAPDGGAGITGGAEVHLGLWLPIIEGCDWTSSDIPKIVRFQLLQRLGHITMMEM